MLLNHISKLIDQVQRINKENELVVKRAKQAIRNYNPSLDSIDELVEAHDDPGCCPRGPQGEQDPRLIRAR